MKLAPSSQAEECEQRLQTCQFCELQLPVKELGQHCEVCGSRTELCRECNRYVKLRDLDEHGLTCSGADAGSDAPPTNDTSSPHTSKEQQETTQKPSLHFILAV